MRKRVLPPPLAADANAPPAQMGRIAGAVVGKSQGDLSTRAILLGCFALAGCIAGRSLSRDAAGDSARHPRDLLRSASALTTGIFAVLVTITFLFFGLDTARTFSSRLSTSLTILVATVSVPGWLTHLLDRSPPVAPRRQP